MIFSDPTVTATSVSTQLWNPSGVFGTGKVMPFATSGTFIVPEDVTSVRVRVWGGGGGGSSNGSYQNGGGGGGFALKTIEGLTSGQTITVTVGIRGNASSSGTLLQTGGTSSFGSYVSATGGYTSSGGNTGAAIGGIGVGGDVNYQGGSGGYSNTSTTCGGGGSANFFGSGGSGGITNGISGTSGGGAAAIGYAAGNGIANQINANSTTTLAFGIDFIGCGHGGQQISLTNFASIIAAVNGGGGCGNNAPNGGFPAGGGGYNGVGGDGLVLVEY